MEILSGGRELDSLLSPWQGDVLPVNYRREFMNERFSVAKLSFRPKDDALTTELPPLIKLQLQ